MTLEAEGLLEACVAQSRSLAWPEWMTAARLITACAMATVGLAACGVQAGERTLVLKERLNQRWTRELVAFPFSAAGGECHRDSLAVESPGGPAVFQLSDVELWPGAEPFVRSATIWLVTDLDPLETRAYLVRFGKEPLKDRELAETDLRIWRSDDAVELSTSHFGARLMLGERSYEEPVAPEEVPGPLIALRTADGAWFGGSRFYGQKKIACYSARLTAGGPLFAEVSYRYLYAEGDVLELRTRIAAGDNALLCDACVTGDGPEDGLEIVLSRGLAPMTFKVKMEAHSRRECFRGKKPGAWAELPLASHPAGLITHLTPWEDWWNDYTQKTIRLKMSDREGELHIKARDAGAWVEPGPLGTLPDWARWHQKLAPLMRSEDGEVYLQVNMAPGQRNWSVVHHVPKVSPHPEQAADVHYDRFRIKRHSLIGRRLNVVKDYVLEWRDRPGRAHPHLFMTREELRAAWERGAADPELVAGFRSVGARMQPFPHSSDARALSAYLISGSREVAQEVKLPQRLRRCLAMLGEYDLMRQPLYVAALYDALMDTDMVAEEERSLFRAQMAYLAYKLADPATWSVERGYGSLNPNMSVSYVLSLGMLACLIPDHPKAAEWARAAVRMMELWMEEVGPKGEWHESCHYTDVSARVMAVFAIAARRAGFKDFFEEGTLKRLALYTGKLYTPPDPQRGDLRAAPPLGRSNAGSRYGLQGVMARATAQSDPEYSRMMQWVWKELGCSHYKLTHRFGGWDYAYLDPTLPAERPDWRTELFPQVGVIMRHGFGSPHEHYVLMITNSAARFARAPEPGSVLKVFSRGRPVGGAFAGGYEHRHELLMSRVLLARAPSEGQGGFRPFGYSSTSELADFAAMPRLDYVCADYAIREPWDVWRWEAPIPEELHGWVGADRAGEPPVDWKRQILFVKGDDPAGAGYLVFRDTVTGGQPTMWQFWTLSQKVGTPGQVRDMDQFLSDRPGQKIVPARELHGDRFTAVGQFDVDVEYYVASPRDTSRHTLRYGATYTYPIGGFKEYQDLLNLQLPGDGHYFVVLFPRFRTEAAPTFETLGDGAVVKVEGGFGTDYCFLSGERVRAEAEGALFEGTAGCVQDRPDGLVLGLGADGKVRYGSCELLCDRPVCLHLRGRDRGEVLLPPEHPGTQVRLLLPGSWALAPGTPPDVRLYRHPRAALHILEVPPGIERVSILGGE